jgi:hypothetical protein
MKKVVIYIVIMAIVLAVIAFILKRTLSFDFRPYAMGILFSFLFILLYRNKVNK